MLAGQTLKASDGYDVMLFPLEYMNISQDEYGQYSHQDILAMDFLGWGANGRILLCPYYAPCNCRCIGTTSSENRIFQSTDKVHLADGTLDYVSWVCAHDNTPISVGTTLFQGTIMGHTGTAGNVTGDHLHLNIAKGVYQNWERVPPSNNWQLKNSMHIYNACYVNDTVIINGENHDWKTYTGPTPIIINKHRFPWPIYARIIRDKKTYI